MRLTPPLPSPQDEPPGPKMGRPGFSSLPEPKPEFNPAYTSGFETKFDVDGADRDRAAALRRQAAKAYPVGAKARRELADSIDPEVTSHPTSMASSRRMRDLRVRTIGALCGLVSKVQEDPTGPSGGQYAAFTVIGEGCTVPLCQLRHSDPRLLKGSFRQDIYRSAAALGVPVEGQLFTVWEGAYDPALKGFSMHNHGLAIGGMVDIVNGLRNLPKYRPAQPHDGRDAANTPVLVQPGPFRDTVSKLTYLLKRYWRLRETRLDDDGVRRAFRTNAQRIPEPAHTEYLRFLDAWRLEDITLVMGMHATKNGLIINV